MRSEVIEQGALSYWLLVERSPAVKRRDCFRDPDDSAWALIAPNYQQLIPSKNRLTIIGFQNLTLHTKSLQQMRTVIRYQHITL